MLGVNDLIASVARAFLLTLGPVGTSCGLPLGGLLLFGLLPCPLDLKLGKRRTIAIFTLALKALKAQGGSGPWDCKEFEHGHGHGSAWGELGDLKPTSLQRVACLFHCEGAQRKPITKSFRPILAKTRIHPPCPLQPCFSMTLHQCSALYTPRIPLVGSHVGYIIWLYKRKFDSVDQIAR